MCGVKSSVYRNVSTFYVFYEDIKEFCYLVAIANSRYTSVCPNNTLMTQILENVAT